MITRKKFLDLKKIKDNSCISIYIPTDMVGDYEKNRIRWKNAVNNAINQLQDNGVKNPEEIMDAAIKYSKETRFWANQSLGFCGFFSKDISQFFHLNQKVKEIVHVGEEFIVHPLLPEITNEDRIFVLAISQNDVRFFEAQKDGIYPVRISQNVVLSKDEALRNIEEDQSLQHHSIGAGDAYFHGNGPGDDMDTTRIKQFIRRVDDGLMEFIHDEKVPLVLASVEEYYALYKEVSNYNHVSNHIIVGNPEDMSPVDIHHQLQPVFEDLKAQRLKEFENRYKINQGQNLSTDDFDEIYQSAKHKNIDTLFIDQQHYSDLNEESLEKLENLVINVYDNSGDIHMVKTDDDEHFSMKAIKRFEMELA